MDYKVVELPVEDNDFTALIMSTTPIVVIVNANLPKVEKDLQIQKALKCYFKLSEESH